MCIVKNKLNVKTWMEGFPSMLWGGGENRFFFFFMTTGQTKSNDIFKK